MKATVVVALVLLRSAIESKISPYIINGYESNSYQNFTAAILTSEYEFKCSGVMLDRYTVLTAAHCISQQDKDPNSYVVCTHCQDLTLETNTFVTPVSITIPPTYDTSLHYSDLAILKLKYKNDKKIKDKFTLYPSVDLGWSSAGNAGDVKLLGFGKEDSESFINSDQLKIANMTMFGVDYCAKVYKSLDHVSGAATTMCAGSKITNQGGCDGDSGGPLIKYTSFSKKPILIGIFSFSEGCASVKYPGIFASVAIYANWIRSLMG